MHVHTHTHTLLPQPFLLQKRSPFHLQAPLSDDIHAQLKAPLQQVMTVVPRVHELVPHDLTAAANDLEEDPGSRREGGEREEGEREEGKRNGGGGCKDG